MQFQQFAVHRLKLRHPWYLLFVAASRSASLGPEKKTVCLAFRAQHFFLDTTKKKTAGSIQSYVNRNIISTGMEFDL
jgi:hypothetical protein